MASEGWGGGEPFFSAKGHMAIYSITRGPYKTIKLKMSLLQMDGLNFESCLCRPWQAQAK